jgi:hypothetical protein
VVRWVSGSPCSIASPTNSEPTIATELGNRRGIANQRMGTVVVATYLLNIADCGSTGTDFLDYTPRANAYMSGCMIKTTLVRLVVEVSARCYLLRGEFAKDMFPWHREPNSTATCPSNGNCVCRRGKCRQHIRITSEQWGTLAQKFGRWLVGAGTATIRDFFNCAIFGVRGTVVTAGDLVLARRLGDNVGVLNLTCQCWGRR